MKDPHIAYDAVRAQQREAFHRELNDALQQRFGLADARLVLGRNTQGQVWEITVYIEHVLTTCRVQLDAKTAPYSPEAKLQALRSIALLTDPVEMKAPESDLRARLTATFHELWGQAAAGTYDKQLWATMQQLLHKLGAG